MSDLNRIKHLAGLTMESGRGLLHEFKAKGLAPPDAARLDRDPEIKDPGYDPNWPRGGSSQPKLIPDGRPGIGIRDPGYDPNWPSGPQPKLPDGGPTDPGHWVYDPDSDPRNDSYDSPSLRDLLNRQNGNPPISGKDSPYYNQDLLNRIKGNKDRMPQKAMNDDVNRLKHLAGLDEKTVYDPSKGHQGPGGYVDREMRQLQGDNQTPIDLDKIKPDDKPFKGFEPEMDINLDAFKDADEIIKRGKENQIIGKYRPPGSPRDPELDDILGRRAKELEPDPRIGRGIIDNDEIKRRIDRIKGKDDIRRYQFGKLK
jgi:hypothetical protein